MLAAALLIPIFSLPAVLYRGAELPGQSIKYWSVEDTTLDSSQSDLNLGGTAYLNGGPGRTILIRFGDLRRALGPNRMVKSASIELTMTSSDVPRMVSASNVLVPWNEGPAMVVNFKALGNPAGQAAVFSATYRNRRAGTNPIAWQSIGCSGIGDATPISQAKGATVGQGIYQITGIENVIQRTYDDPFESGGLALRFETPCEFFSSQAPEGRPRLVVETEVKSPLGSDLSVVLVSRAPWSPNASISAPLIVDVDGKKVPVWQGAQSSSTPKDGEVLTYTATLKNVGTKQLSGFSCRWAANESWGGWADYQRKLLPGESTTVTYQKPFQSDIKDHRVGKVAIQVQAAEDANPANNGLETFENGIGIQVALPTSIDAENVSPRGSASMEDWAQSALDELNRVVLPYSRASFAPDGPRERFFIQSFAESGATNDFIIAFEPSTIGMVSFFRSALTQAGLSIVSAPPPSSMISTAQGPVEIRRPAPLAPSLFGGGESRFDGGLPGFLAMPPEPYANPLFDSIVMEASGLLSMTEVYGLESRLTASQSNGFQYLYDQPVLALFKAQAMDGRPLKGAKIRVFDEATSSDSTGALLCEAVAGNDGTFTIPDRKIPINHPRLKANIFGVLDARNPNSGLIVEAEFFGQKGYSFFSPWQMTDMRARAGMNPVVFDLRYNFSDGAIGTDNLAKGKLVVDSLKSLPARLAALVDDKPTTEATLPGETGSWIEIDLGRDRIIGMVALVVGEGSFWQDFEIAGYNTGQLASDAVVWRRDRNFDWSRKNLAEREGESRIVRYRAAAQQFRYLRLRCRAKLSGASLRDIQVFGASAPGP